MSWRYSLKLDYPKVLSSNKGVLNLVHGTRQVVEELCDHPDVRAVTFVGTSRVAESITHRCRLLNKRVLALGICV